MITRIRQTLLTRWYKFAPTERLIDQIRIGNSGPNVQPMLDALRERLAYQDGSLESVNWSMAALNGVVLSSCRLAKANFAGADLKGSYFGYSDLRGTCFAKADLREANLREARLEGADMSGADLHGANLARVDLRRGQLVSASLTSANLWETDLRGTDLSGADLSDCAFHRVKTDRSTILPDGAACEDVSEFSPFIGTSSSK